MFTKESIKEFANELERRVQLRDSNYTVRVQQEINQLFGTSLMVYIESAVHCDTYSIDVHSGTWIRRLDF